jgi:hypothetical protein
MRFSRGSKEGYGADLLKTFEAISHLVRRALHAADVDTTRPCLT